MSRNKKRIKKNRTGTHQSKSEQPTLEQWAAAGRKLLAEKASTWTVEDWARYAYGEFKQREEREQMFEAIGLCVCDDCWAEMEASGRFAQRWQVSIEPANPQKWETSNQVAEA